MRRIVNRHSPPSPSGQHRRRAIVTVMVLLVLILMSSLLAQFVRRSMADNRQTRKDLHQQQARQLVIAGVDTLYARLDADENYSGETWDIAAGQIHQTNTGQVVISISEDTADIVARYPTNMDHPIRVTKTVRLSK